MAVFSGPLQALIDEMGRLPGIGPKSAQRITFHLLKVAPEDAMRLAEAIIAVKELGNALFIILYGITQLHQLYPLVHIGKRQQSH